MMGTVLGGDINILTNISNELKKHPTVSITVFPPREGPFAPAFSHCISCERGMTVKEYISEPLDDYNRVDSSLDSIPQYIISDGDYHIFQTTVFMIEKGDAKKVGGSH